ncbi:M14 family metallopeptidase [Fusibacter ferrireducens]|uniref:DUF2817 domain-containing protein n=1 Tax=Fusibacter ferrireducens TaxID=2785058 RepID=A0ABR9ZXM2_9FIRM|nr:M14 family metallopeptidase [Fusibacter ferrireducens]MBF4694893.1 DUF2817 domain-containing protein [Fusibacter ferrireducens]
MIQLHALKSYEAAKETFRCVVGVAREHYRICVHHSTSFEEDVLLTTESAYICDSDHPEKLLILTSGMHGVEGFVGSEMINRVITKHYKEMNASKTALLVINFINPWGMKYFRRVNRHNIDLNRNFIHGATPYNAHFYKLKSLLNADWQGKFRLISLIRYYFTLFKCIMDHGVLNTKQAIFSGQYEFPEQIYFGGLKSTSEHENVIDLIHRFTEDSVKQVIHFDLHTGYGPRNELSLINSSYDALNPFLWKRNLKLDHVEISDVHGDLIDYLYLMGKQNHRDCFHTCAEFGTLGHSLYHKFESLRVTILENAIWQGKIESQKIKEKILKKFVNIYCPNEASWWLKAESDFDQLMQNTISYFNL